MSNLPTALPKWIADHVRMYREDPDSAHMWDATVAGGNGLLATLLLTSTGRRSGEPRPLPLIYKKVGDNYVVIASKGGAPTHPAWYLNLIAEPNCHVQVAKDEMDATARTASDTEREDLWSQLVEVYPPYADYQKSAGDREIPVVVLEPK